MLTNNVSINNKSRITISVPSGEQYSDGFKRDAFLKTSAHCPYSEVTLQVSNLESPCETNDADWYNIGRGFFVSTDYAFLWGRVKFDAAVEQETPVYLVSIK